MLLEATCCIQYAKYVTLFICEPLVRVMRCLFFDPNFQELLMASLLSLWLQWLQWILSRFLFIHHSPCSNATLNLVPGLKLNGWGKCLRAYIYIYIYTSSTYMSLYKCYNNTHCAVQCNPGLMSRWARSLAPKVCQRPVGEGLAEEAGRCLQVNQFQLLILE